MAILKRTAAVGTIFRLPVAVNPLVVAFQVVFAIGGKLAARDEAALGRLLSARHSKMAVEVLFPFVGPAAIVANETATVAVSGWR